MRREQQSWFLLLEQIFVFAALFFFLGAVLPVLQNPGDSAGIAKQSDSLALAIQLSIFLFTALFAFTVRSGITDALVGNPLLVSLLILALASTAWSSIPDLTLRRAICLMIITIFAFYLGVRYTPSEILRLFAYVLFTAALLSAVFIFLLPQYGTEGSTNVGAWRGVFIQKNIFARYMVIAIVTFICLKAESSSELFMKISGIFIACILVTGSLSAGSYAMAALSTVLIPTMKAFRLPLKRLLPVSVFLAILAATALVIIRLNAHDLLLLLGRNATLTGRVPLWHILVKKLVEHPVLGYGLNGFWSAYGYSVWNLLNLPHMAAAHAHNGYLDVSLDLGLLGLGIFLLSALITLWRCLLLIATRRTRESEWPLLLVLLILCYNFFESDLIHQNGILWIALVAVSVSTQRALQHRITEPRATRCAVMQPIESIPCVP